ncbi:hypothetical protein R4Z09_25345 [Niallia oryzisoli]|uniref:Uncharacterized protein n=1 Tax=Niallia oryzisoli TaxID=1737571 RepID=A0ABZ2CDE0_9BACI
MINKKAKKRLTTEERLESMVLKENQGGDLSNQDYAVYVLFGVIFPGVLLIWGWL